MRWSCSYCWNGWREPGDARALACDAWELAKWLATRYDLPSAHARARAPLVSTQVLLLFEPFEISLKVASASESSLLCPTCSTRRTSLPRMTNLRPRRSKRRKCRIGSASRSMIWAVCRLLKAVGDVEGLLFAQATNKVGAMSEPEVPSDN